MSLLNYFYKNSLQNYEKSTKITKFDDEQSKHKFHLRNNGTKKVTPLLPSSQ